MKELQISSNWTLFLDRDGVINEKLDGDYVKSLEEFQFIPGSKEAIVRLKGIFQRIVIVTNQQGIGKGLMTHEDLKQVHDFMISEINDAGGKIDSIYYCPELANKNAACRKPNTGMALEAKKDFPEIDFQNSIMVGDSISDIEMGNRLEMKTVYLSDSLDNLEIANYQYKSLQEFANSILD